MEKSGHNGLGCAKAGNGTGFNGIKQVNTEKLADANSQVAGTETGEDKIMDVNAQQHKWTSEQLDAICATDCNLLVAAAAGAGKTAVLVERIIRKITDEKNPVDIDRMLIVTFTNAAAAEMRERIGDAISKELDKDPGRENIRRQLSLLGKASIMTIHSFCNDVIRKNIEYLDLDPGFRVADDTECTLMRLEAMTEMLEEEYEQEHADFLELLECYGGNRNDQAIQDMVMALYNFIQSSPWPDIWLDEKLRAMDVPQGTDFSQTVWGRLLLNTVLLELEGLKPGISEAIGIISRTDGLEKYMPVFYEDLSIIDGLIGIVKRAVSNPANGIDKPVSQSSESGNTPANSIGYWDMLYDAVNNVKFSRLPNAGKNVDREKKDIVQQIRKTVKDTVTRFRKKFINARSEEIIQDMETMHCAMACLVRLVREFTRRYSDKKKRKAILDFNDLEHFCLQILTETTENGIAPSKTALEYREQFNEIMVDEYQDSNMVQEIIISMISKDKPDHPNVFMVGDVKQSIYRFRQARPELFLHKYYTYSQAPGSSHRKIMLYKNFRSRAEILNAINFLFKQIMSENVGELDYTDNEALNPGIEFEPCDNPSISVGGPVEFHILQTDDELPVMAGAETDTEDTAYGDVNEDGEEPEILDNIQSEARLVAHNILKLMSPDDKGNCFHVFDKSKKAYRKLEYRDIVILLRATKNWSEVFTDELSMMGIPVFADTGTGFFKTVEIQVVLSLLQIIDNPLQDIPLLSVLRSPIFGFTTNELAEVRMMDKKAMLFDALKLLAEKHTITEGEQTLSSTAEKASAFIEKLGRWRRKAPDMSTDQLLWYLYQDTGYYGMVGAMPAGEQRQANLRILYDRARQFEQTSYKGLFNFVNFIDRLKSSQGDMGSAKILGENDNVVRIMSIHKSKGLEFPVVFLSGCGKRFNLTDLNRSILFHHELGFGPDIVDYKLRVARPSTVKLTIRERLRTELLSEEMRVLYVALTRAREKLIITGSVPDIQKSVSKWLRVASTQDDKLPHYEMIKAASFIDWIGPALLRHRANEESFHPLLAYARPGSEFSGRMIDDPSKWVVNVWKKSDLLNSNISEVREDNGIIRWLDSFVISSETSGYYDDVAKRLEWDYPYSKVNKIPAKITVTELKRRFESEFADVSRVPVYVPPLIKKPLFLEAQKGLSAAEKGTVLHFVMQHLDFKNPDIKGQLEEMVKKDLLTIQQAQSVSIYKISRFLTSPLGKRMLAAKSIQREVPFNLEIPCHEFYLEMTDEQYRDETLLLQGIIDCYFEEPDGLVLVDYKTDYVPPGGIETIIGRYRVQLDYYARALAVLTGKKVKEKYIYLFSIGEILQM